MLLQLQYRPRPEGHFDATTTRRRRDAFYTVSIALLQWNLYKRTLPTADTSHKRTKIIFPNELGIFLIRSTLPRADTSGERTADKIFVQKCKKISKFTSISGQNKKINIMIKQKIHKQFRKIGYFVLIRRIRIFMRIFNDRDYIFLAIQEGQRLVFNSA